MDEQKTFVTALHINKVRHLKDIMIPLSDTKRKHLILTGKNGSGKTSTLREIARYLQGLAEHDLKPGEELYPFSVTEYVRSKEAGAGIDELASLVLFINDNMLSVEIAERFAAGQFVIAFYTDERRTEQESYQHIETVTLNDRYQLTDNPGTQLTKYLSGLKATQAFALVGGKKEKAQEIEERFTRFENLMRLVYDAPELSLNFNDETFQFTISLPGREEFDFNTMSSGYSAVFAIIVDLMMRMEKHASNGYDMEGIVLIDEPESHLHIELQKKILPVLTGFFPNIQFIIATHSPFIISSLENAVIFDLETQKRVPNGLANLPVEGIVEGYFGSDRLSGELRKKFKRYQELAAQSSFSDADYAELDELEMYLEEIPDYLAPELNEEYRRIKLELDSRE